jgi:predicted RNA-binding protein YlqC (UPF0109 family)
MKDLAEQMVKSVVDYPEQVEITEVNGLDSLILEIRVAPDDMGRVIGRNGRIINAMRTIVSAASAAKGTERTSLEIIEPKSANSDERAHLTTSEAPEPYSDRKWRV